MDLCYSTQSPKRLILFLCFEYDQFRVWSMCCLSSTVLTILILRFFHSYLSSAWRSRCVKLASPPPLRINSTSQILKSESTLHNSRNGVWKSSTRIALAWFWACTSNPLSAKFESFKRLRKQSCRHRSANPVDTRTSLDRPIHTILYVYRAQTVPDMVPCCNSRL